MIKINPTAASGVLRGIPLPAPLAENTRTTGPDTHTCAVCGCQIRPGQRIADLSDGTGVVHVAGCAALTGRRRQHRRHRSRIAAASS